MGDFTPPLIDSRLLQSREKPYSKCAAGTLLPFNRRTELKAAISQAMQAKLQKDGRGRIMQPPRL
jgi:hypothetical protein